MCHYFLSSVTCSRARYLPLLLLTRELGGEKGGGGGARSNVVNVRGSCCAVRARDVSANQVVHACFCSCKYCRKARAAPIYQVVYVKEAAFEFTQGKEYVKECKRPPYDANANTILDKHPGRTRLFCSECGTKVANRLPGVQDATIYGLFPSLLDEETQHALPASCTPTTHANKEHAVPLFGLCL